MRSLIVLVLLLLMVSPVLAQTATPVPTIEPPDNHDLFQGLADADAQLRNADVDPLAPNGVSIIPAADGREIFKYIKYIGSATAAEDLFGPFSPIFLHLGIYLAGMIALTVLYVIIYVASYIIRWIIFLIRLIAQIVQAVASIIGAVTGAIGNAIGGAAGAIGGVIGKVIGR